MKPIAQNPATEDVKNKDADKLTIKEIFSTLQNEDLEAIEALSKNPDYRTKFIVSMFVSLDEDIREKYKPFMPRLMPQPQPEEKLLSYEGAKSAVSDSYEDAKSFASGAYKLLNYYYLIIWMRSASHSKR